MSIKWNDNSNGLIPVSGWTENFRKHDSFNGIDSGLSPTQAILPSVNVKESSGNYEMDIEIPGMNKEDFDITRNGILLVISLEKRIEGEETLDEYTRREFSYQSFCYSFELPKDIADEEPILAKYEDGTLRLTVPKKERPGKRAPQKIAIS